MKRTEILTLLKEMRASSPRTSSPCHRVALRETGRNGETADYELHLKWVPDEHSRTFLKIFLQEHNLTMKEKGKNIIINNQTRKPLLYANAENKPQQTPS